MSDETAVFRLIVYGEKTPFVPPSLSPTLVFVTCRTVQGRFLFRPGPEFNDLFLGILGRAQRRHDMRICGVCVMSSHFHLLLVVDDVRQLARFMRDLKSKLAREVNRLTGWRGTVFHRRYDMAVVTEEEAAQAGRLAYILSHGVKEKLVERAQEWPGVHCVKALLNRRVADGPLVQPQPGVRRPQPAAGLRTSPLRHGRDGYALAHPLLGAPVAGALSNPHCGPGRVDRDRGRRREETYGSTRGE